MLVRLDVQVFAAHGAEPLAVGPAEDLLGQREGNRVARPGIASPQAAEATADWPLKNASNSAFTWSLSVVHMPCGAPL